MQPLEEFSFLFNTLSDPGIGLSRDRADRIGRASYFLRCPVRSRLILENPREMFICTPGRTHNRIRSPRLAASGQ